MSRTHYSSSTVHETESVDVRLVSLYHRYEQFPTKYSLAALRLTSYLLTVDGANPSIASYHLRDDPGETARNLLASDPDIVGLSAYLWTADQVREICTEIRKRDEYVTVVVGGPETLKLDYDEWPDDVLYTAAEGEEPMEWLVDLKRRRGYVDTEEVGLHHMVFTPSRMGELTSTCENEIPVGEPLFSEEFCEVLGDELDTDFVWFDTQIGCLFDCGFCGHKLRDDVAKRPNDVVKDEIRNIGRIGFDRVFVIDPILGAVPGRDVKVLEWFSEYAPDTSMKIYLRPELIHDNALDALEDVKVTEVITGLQTVNPDIPVWLRDNNVEKVKERIELLSKRSFPNRVELITGLPGDDFDGLRHSIQYVIDELRPSLLMAYRLTVITGTELEIRIHNPESDVHVETNEKMQAISSNSYSEAEMDRMLRYSTGITSLYNLVQEEHDCNSYEVDVSFEELDGQVAGALERRPEVFDGYNYERVQEFWKDELDSTANPRSVSDVSISQQF